MRDRLPDLRALEALGLSETTDTVHDPIRSVRADPATVVRVGPGLVGAADRFPTGP